VASPRTSPHGCIVYRRRLKQHLVHTANRLALSGMVLLVLSLASAILLILDAVLGPWPALVLACGVFAWFVTLWSCFRCVSGSGTRRRAACPVRNEREMAGEFSRSVQGRR
jgi:hypothetical protein